MHNMKSKNYVVDYTQLIDKKLKTRKEKHIAKKQENSKQKKRNILLKNKEIQNKERETFC